MSSKTLLTLCIENHPCKEQFLGTTQPPDCLASEKGRCSEYENAIFCPKYGEPVGVMRKYGAVFIEKESGE